MCGIIGYAGPRAAGPILVDSLRRLEYRGYDSAGIAIVDGRNGHSTVIKSTNKVAELAAQMEKDGAPVGHLGIGHTRWATHGRPTLLNAHPHQDCSGRISLIHNGIIENYRELRAELIADGHEFRSDTDTEVVPHLIEKYYAGDLGEAVRATVERILGAYALVAVHADEPERIVGARLNAPLVVGIGQGEVFISSDITALIPYTKRIALIGEQQVVSASPDSLRVIKQDGNQVEPTFITVEWEAEQAQKGGYPHYMLKEIYEQPEAVESALRGRIGDQGLVDLQELGIAVDRLAQVENVSIVACGSAWIAGLASKYALESLARLRCTADTASEFRYGDPLVDEKTLVLAFSQSGETADTLAAVREAKAKGALVLAVTNVVGSALSREADGVLYMQSGPEICVLATKTFLSQIVCGILLALHLAHLRRAITVERHLELVEELKAVPQRISAILAKEERFAEMAQRYAHARNALYIGRGVNFPVALEGALKLKEVSYIHAEGYAAGELKHGPIALLDSEVPVVALATSSQILPKVISNIQEVLSREAPLIAIVSEGQDDLDISGIRDIVEVPLCDELISPLINVIPLQLLAYHIAVKRGCDVDQPRNLAKSVTVE